MAHILHVHKETAIGVDIMWISVGAAVTQAALASVLQLATALATVQHNGNREDSAGPQYADLRVLMEAE